MKKLFFLVMLSVTVQGIFAQWTTSGSQIYNSNSGNVGIGTTSPATLLHIAGYESANWTKTFDNNGNLQLLWDFLSCSQVP